MLVLSSLLELLFFICSCGYYALTLCAFEQVLADVFTDYTEISRWYEADNIIII